MLDLCVKFLSKYVVKNECTFIKKEKLRTNASVHVGELETALMKKLQHFLSFSTRHFFF